MTARPLISICSATLLVLLTACATEGPRGAAIGDARGVVNNPQIFGNISGIEVVPMASRPSGGGALLGAVIGGALGNQVGAGMGRAAATGVGVIGGAMVGNNVEQRRHDGSEYYRVSVRFDDGAFGHFDYQRIDDLRVGDRVKIEAGQLYRV
jgi:outer membrane lipoprotein SlyB